MASFEKAMEKAQALDMAESEVMEQVAPKGDFSKDSMNRFIEAVNKVAAEFGKVPVLPGVEEDVDQMPGPVQKYVMMINKALEDSGFTEYSIELDSITGDRDLMMARGRLDAAANDRAFKSFLKKPMPQEDSEMEVEISVEAPASEAPRVEEEEDEDIDQLMMSRMRR